MAELSITAFVSLDGVMQAPGRPEEDPRNGFKFGGWLVPFSDDVFGAFMGEVFADPGAFLLGRTTYEIFSTYWPSQDKTNNPAARFLNELPKYVASRTLKNASWGPATIVRDVVAEVRKLKEKPGKELQVHGSAGLAKTLIQHDLIDVYRVLTAPVILGNGTRLFDEHARPRTLEAIDSRTTSTGMTIVTYRRAGDVEVGSF